MGQEPQAEGGNAGRCLVILRGVGQALKEALSTPMPRSQEHVCAWPEMPQNLDFSSPLPLCPQDVLEPIQLQQPFAKRVS